MEGRMKNGNGRVLLLPLIWAFVFAIPGGVIELLANLGMAPSFASNVDMWPQTLALPGLIGGVLFAVAVLATRMWTRFETLSLGRLAGAGAIVGLTTGLLVMALGYIDGSAVELSFTTTMGALSAIASGVVVRMLAQRRVRARA